MSTETLSAAPTQERHLHYGWALVLITVAQLMVVLDATIANIALPFIGKDLDMTSSLTWVVTGYSLAFGGLLLLGGRLGDLYGRRRIFMAGLILFALASLVGGVATSEPLLLVGRGLQGVGAALASPAALALITTTFPAGPRRNRAFAVYAAMSGIGAAVGLILGGWLTGSDFSVFGADVHGWRMTFLINVPIGIAAALLAPRILPESERHPGELDVPGAITATLGLLSLVYGLTRAGNADYGWTDTWTLAALTAGVVLLAVFVAVESRMEHPLLPFRIFNNRTRAASFVAMMLVPAAMFAMFFFLSLFIQNVMGYSPLKTGVAFLPFSIVMIFSATTASKLISRVDPRFLAGIGTLFSAAALFGFSRITVPDSGESVLQAFTSGQHLGAGVSYWAHIFPFVCLMALGMGFNFVPLTLTATHHIRREDSGIGSGVLNTMQQVGGALGLALLSTVSSHFITDHAAKIAPTVGKGLAAADPSVMGKVMETLGVTSPQAAIGQVSYLGSFTTGATHAFLVGVALVLVASTVIWLFLDVSHVELASDAAEHPEAGVHVG